MTNLTAKLGLWSTVTSTLKGRLHEIRDLGFDYIVARIVHHPDGANGPTAAYLADELRDVIADAATVGIDVAAWAYVYPKQIARQAEAIAAALPVECAALVLDAEVEWESAARAADLAGQLCEAIAGRIDHRVGLYLSSFCNPISHPVPYAAFLAHCQGLMPQSYRFAPISTATVVERTLTHCPGLSSHSLGGILIPTINCPEMLTALIPHSGAFHGANVWLWDGAGQDRGVDSHLSDWTQPIKAWKAAKSTGPKVPAL